MLTLFSLALMVGLQIFLILLSHWSIGWKQFARFSKVVDATNCALTLFCTGKKCKTSNICMCARSTSPWSKRILFPASWPGMFVYFFWVLIFLKDQIWFSFQQRRFVYSDDEQQFVRIQLPINLPFRSYMQHKGLKSENIEEAMKKYGQNKFVVPKPSLMELFREQALAPFFVFQVFSIGLWALDDMWYYSAFTLAMLALFEYTIAKKVYFNACCCWQLLYRGCRICRWCEVLKLWDIILMYIAMASGSQCRY